jgi:uncharacterized protein YeaC (DUF1315 family)
MDKIPPVLQPKTDLAKRIRDSLDTIQEAQIKGRKMTKNLQVDPDDLQWIQNILNRLPPEVDKTEVLRTARRRWDDRKNLAIQKKEEAITSVMIAFKATENDGKDIDELFLAAVKSYS